MLRIFMSCKWSLYTASGSFGRLSSASGTRPSRFPRWQRAFVLCTHAHIILDITVRVTSSLHTCSMTTSLPRQEMLYFNEPVPEMSSTPQTPSGPSSPNRPGLLISPNLLNYQSPERNYPGGIYISAIISGLAFCDLFQAATNSGKSRFLDGASPQGPSSSLTRMPKSDRFRFLDSGFGN